MNSCRYKTPILVVNESGMFVFNIFYTGSMLFIRKCHITLCDEIQTKDTLTRKQ